MGLCDSIWYFWKVGVVGVTQYGNFGRSVWSVSLDMLILEGLCGLCDSIWQFWKVCVGRSVA